MKYIHQAPSWGASARRWRVNSSAGGSRNSGGQLDGTRAPSPALSAARPSSAAASRSGVAGINSSRSVRIIGRAGGESRPGELEVSHVRGGHGAHQAQAFQVFDPVEQSLAAAEKGGDQVDIHLVHQAGGEVLLRGLGAA